MKFVIIFFRDILNGPLYIITSVICGILICSCIGYLAEQAQIKKKEEEAEDQYVDVSQTYNSNESLNSNNTVSNTNEIKTQDV